MKLLPPRWIAHRGGGSLAPENTLAGIRLAASLGFRAVEFDVMLSGDGTPFLIHDETLERTTDGHGPVCETPDAVMLTLDAGQGEPIPTLAQAATLCRQFGLLANVEIKPVTGHERRTAEVVVAQCLELWQGAEIQPLLSSFSLEAMAIARNLAPDMPRGLLFEQVPAEWRQILCEYRAMTLHCNALHVTPDVVEEVNTSGIPVLCYTVNRPELAEMLLASGVGSFFTDRLDLFAETSAYKALQLDG
jgi:glycerophosphoryl diester phosphodiesterase